MACLRLLRSRIPPSEGKQKSSYQCQPRNSELVALRFQCFNPVITSEAIPKCDFCALINDAESIHQVIYNLKVSATLAYFHFSLFLYNQWCILTVPRWDFSQQHWC